jgi:Resolvase, N terminal domain
VRPRSLTQINPHTLKSAMRNLDRAQRNLQTSPTRVDLPCLKVRAGPRLGLRLDHVPFVHHAPARADAAPSLHDGEKKAGSRSLGDTWADTTTSHGRLMLTVLGGLAEFERDLIRARTSEDRARAVANGVKLGRKPTLTPHQRREAIRRVNAEKETLGEIARSYNVSRWTISRLCAKPPNKSGCTSSR